MVRKSGTRSIAPQSGSVQTTNNVQSLSQADNITLIRSSSTNVAGYLKITGQVGPTIIFRNNTANVGSVNNPSAGEPFDIDQTLFSTTAERQAAGAYFSGGVGIEKDLSVGGFIYGRIATANTATTSSNIVVLKTNQDATYFPLMTDGAGIVQDAANLYADILNQDGGTGGLRYNPYRGKITTERLGVISTDSSTSTTTGAFTVTGGVGIGQDVYIGGSILRDNANTGTIGAQDYEWADAYLNKVYSKFIGSTASSLTLAPGAGITDIFGDIRVRGQTPIGTAPVVTNTLYVTMDGDDTNDGRAQDASRACRTIGGAMQSPYYQPGTQILVSAGRYLENNPLVMKPYTSVRGSDIRTTFIEPINNKQDLFHVKSGF
jgi:hypothetical protein